MRTAFLFVILGVAGACLSVAHADDKILKAEELPLPRLFIEKEDNDLWKQAPKDGVIAGPKAWTKLWKTWGGDKEAPKVDFEKELVLVAAGPGPNIIKVENLKLDDKGDLKFKWSITERGGDGFVAKFLKVSREGVKTVNGKALPKE
jgi:hypothetical protein